MGYASWRALWAGRLGLAIQLVAVVALAVTAYFVHYQPAMFDDAWIYFRYARNIADGIGFVFNPGEQVLGSSVIGFPVLLGLFGAIGADIPMTAVGLGVVCVVYTAVLLFLWLGKEHGKLVAWIAVALLLTHPSFVPVASRGMETPLYAALILTAVFLYGRGRTFGAFLCAGFCMYVRLDAAITVVALLSGVHLVHHRRIPWRALAIPIALGVIWLVFGKVYFGTVMPQPVVAKRFHTGSEHSIFDFAFHVLAENPSFTLFLAGIGVLASVRARHVAGLALTAWLVGYVVVYTILGVHTYPWYVAPAQLAVVVFAAWGAAALLRLVSDDHVARIALAILILLTLGVQTVHQRFGVFGSRECGYAATEAIRWRFAQVAGDRIPANKSVAAAATGAVGWYTGAYVLDTGFILNTEPPRAYPAPYFLNAMLDQVNRHKPDFIFSDTFAIGSLESLSPQYRIVEQYHYNCNDGVRSGTMEIWERSKPGE